MCYRVNKRSQTSWSVFNVYRQSYDFLQSHRCGYVRLQWLQPSSSVSQPSEMAGSQSPLNHVTTLQPWPMSNVPSHAHSKEPIKPLHVTHGYFEPSKALHKYSSRSVFILTALLCSAKVCNPNVLKVIPTQVRTFSAFLVRRPAKRVRDSWQPSRPFGNYFV